MASPRGYLDDALWLSDASETGLVGCCAFKTATAAVLGGSSQGSPWNPEKSPLFVAYPSCRYELWLRSTDIHGMILQVVSLLGGQLAEICEKISDQQVNDGKPEESFCFFFDHRWTERFFCISCISCISKDRRQLSLFYHLLSSLYQKVIELLVGVSNGLQG